LKTCSKCRKRKQASEFPPNRRCRDGLDSWCRECRREDARRWRRENPAKVEAYNIARSVVRQFIWDPELKTYIPNPSFRPKSKVR
jgi:hypothetical protein